MSDGKQSFYCSNQGPSHKFAHFHPAPIACLFLILLSVFLSQPRITLSNTGDEAMTHVKIVLHLNL